MPGFSVPAGSLDFWANRFAENKVKHDQPVERFSEIMLPFQDPDGLKLNLIVPGKEDARQPWETGEIKSDAAVKGFHSITLTLRDVKPTAEVLTEIFDYKLLKQEGNFYRFVVLRIAVVIFLIFYTTNFLYLYGQENSDIRDSVVQITVSPNTKAGRTESLAF